MQLRIIDPRENRQWDGFVRSHPQGTIYHLSHWLAVLEDTYGYSPLCFVLVNQGKQIIAGLPFLDVSNFFMKHRLISLPFTDVCGPLYIHSDDCRQLMNGAITYVKERQSGQCEIRMKEDLHSPDMVRVKNYHISVVNLNADYQQRVSKRFRRYVRNVGHRYLRLSVSTDMNAVRTFYHLNLLTRRRHGIISQPFSLFRNIQRHMLDKGYGFIAIVYLKDVPVAAGCYFTLKDVIYHKYTGTDRRYSQYRGNHLLVWEVMKYAFNNGYRYYDFGRTDARNNGLLHFKESWGAKSGGLTYYYYPTHEGVSTLIEHKRLYTIATATLSKLPLKALELLGTMAYRFCA
jgi:hypothetical protein